MDLAPGEVLVVDERVPSLAATQPTTGSARQSVWLVADDGATSRAPTAAYLGEATVSPDGRVQLRAPVPSVVAVRTNRFGPAVPQPIALGDHHLEGIAGLVVAVRVTRAGPPLEFTVARPVAIEAGRQVLGDADLAGVAFGAPDDSAEMRLIGRFGAPTGGREWSDACVGQSRWVWWGDLVVEFRRDGPTADGRFVSYAYGRRSWWFEDGVPSPASVTGLGTASNVTLGTSVPQLRGVADGAEFRTDYDGMQADRWVSPSGGLVAVLDHDFLRSDAKVARISAPAATALTVC